MTDNTTWHERNDVAVEVEDTDVGREVSLFERVNGDWKRQFTLSAGQARDYAQLFSEVFPDE